MSFTQLWLIFQWNTHSLTHPLFNDVSWSRIRRQNHKQMILIVNSAGQSDPWLSVCLNLHLQVWVIGIISVTNYCFFREALGVLYLDRKNLETETVTETGRKWCTRKHVKIRYQLLKDGAVCTWGALSENLLFTHKLFCHLAFFLQCVFIFSPCCSISEKIVQNPHLFWHLHVLFSCQ